MDYYYGLFRCRIFIGGLCWQWHWIWIWNAGFLCSVITSIRKFHPKELVSSKNGQACKCLWGATFWGNWIEKASILLYFFSDTKYFTNLLSKICLYTYWRIIYWSDEKTYTMGEATFRSCWGQPASYIISNLSMKYEYNTKRFWGH